MRRDWKKICQTSNGDDIYVSFTDFGADEDSTGVEIYGAVGDYSAQGGDRPQAA